MTTNYQKGRNKEYRIKQRHEKEGWEVVRSAGSHSPFDLICIRAVDQRIKFIQCKSKNFSKKEEERLLKKYNWLKDGIFLTDYEIIR